MTEEWPSWFELHRAVPVLCTPGSVICLYTVVVCMHSVESALSMSRLLSVSHVKLVSSFRRIVFPRVIISMRL